MMTKSSSEISVFRAFAKVVKITGVEIDPATIENKEPPGPDIKCLVNGRRYFFELSQILDEDLARDIGNSEKKRIDSDGAWFSEEEPLIGRIRAKAKKTYSTNGGCIDLLLYYERQFPFAPTEYLKNYEAEIRAALLPQGPFSRIWIFDLWTDAIIWKRES
jgi:hypothetical protein